MKTNRVSQLKEGKWVENYVNTSAYLTEIEIQEVNSN